MSWVGWLFVGAAIGLIGVVRYPGGTRLRPMQGAVTGVIAASGASILALLLRVMQDGSVIEWAVAIVAAFVAVAWRASRHAGRRSA